MGYVRMHQRAYLMCCETRARVVEPVGHVHRTDCGTEAVTSSGVRAWASSGHGMHLGGGGRGADEGETEVREARDEGAHSGCVSAAAQQVSTISEVSTRSGVLLVARKALKHSMAVPSTPVYMVGSLTRGPLRFHVACTTSFLSLRAALRKAPECGNECSRYSGGTHSATRGADDGVSGTCCDLAICSGDPRHGIRQSFIRFT